MWQIDSPTHVEHGWIKVNVSLALFCCLHHNPYWAGAPFPWLHSSRTGGVCVRTCVRVCVGGCKSGGACARICRMHSVCLHVQCVCVCVQPCTARTLPRSEAENTEMLDSHKQTDGISKTRTKIQKANVSARQKKTLLNIKPASSVLILSLIFWTKKSWSSRVEGKPIQVLSVLVGFGEVTASMLCSMPAATRRQHSMDG